jgi:hypothetical protein
MKTNKYWGGFAVFALALGTVSGAAQTTFTVTASGFSAYLINGTPNPTLTLTRGVTYQFNVNTSGHPFWIKTVSSTGTNNAYMTGVVNNGVQVGTLTFAVPMSAPNTLFYNCQIHAAMAGTINIINPPFPPIVALTNPASGITLAAPATLTLQASASDQDGTVTNVQFFSGTTLLGNDTTAPFSFTATNLAAGFYNFTAQATDNSGLSATSTVVAVLVVTPSSAAFDANLSFIGDQLPLHVHVTPGLTYNIEYTSTLTNWLLFTNFVATNSMMNFSLPVTGTNQLFFRALLLPNP